MLGLSFNALWYKGSTSDFGSESRGSNPLGATINAKYFFFIVLIVRISFVVLLVEKLIALFFLCIPNVFLLI